MFSFAARKNQSKSANENIVSLFAAYMFSFAAGSHINAFGYMLANLVVSSIKNDLYLTKKKEIVCIDHEA